MLIVTSFIVRETGNSLNEDEWMRGQDIDY